MSSLTAWESLLTDLLNEFHSTTNPLESNFQSAVQSFKQITGTLIGPKSGPDAFQGQAAGALGDAVGICAARDQALISANVLGQATTACTNYVQKINEAASYAASFATDENVLDEVLAAMTIFQAAQYGASAIPGGVISQVANQVNHPGNAIGAGIRAMDAERTLGALEEMAMAIHDGVAPWEQALEGDVSSHSALWDTVDQVWVKAMTLFGLLTKTLSNEKFKAFADKLGSGKGSYIAALGFLLSLLSNPPKNLNDFMPRLFGSGIGFAAGTFIPGVGEVLLALGLTHQFGPLLADGQAALAQQLSKEFDDPQLAKELEAPDAGIRQGANEINPGSVFNDLGGIIWTSSPTYQDMYGQNQSRKAELQDWSNLGNDTWKVVDGSWKFSANVLGAGLDDVVTLSIGKNDAVAAQIVDHYINDGTHFVANLPDNVGHFATSTAPHAVAHAFSDVGHFLGL